MRDHCSSRVLGAAGPAAVPVTRVGQGGAGSVGEGSIELLHEVLVEADVQRTSANVRAKLNVLGDPYPLARFTEGGTESVVGLRERPRIARGQVLAHGQQVVDLLLAVVVGREDVPVLEDVTDDQPLPEPLARVGPVASMGPP